MNVSARQRSSTNKNKINTRKSNKWEIKAIAQANQIHFICLLTIIAFARFFFREKCFITWAYRSYQVCNWNGASEMNLRKNNNNYIRCVLFTWLLSLFCQFDFNVKLLQTHTHKHINCVRTHLYKMCAQLIEPIYSFVWIIWTLLFPVWVSIFLFTENSSMMKWPVSVKFS